MRELVELLPWVPKTCTWELTLSCNMKCGHCGSSAGKPRSSEMSREKALRVVGELAALGCRKLSLSGGEPTLAPHWADIASEGSRLGLHVNMIVNGSRHDRVFVRHARDAGLVSLGISLDGLASTHDHLRRLPGSFDRVMALLDDCAAVGLPVGVITTLWRGNVHELERMQDLLAGRVYTWQIQLGAAMGNLSRANQLAPADLLHIVPTVATMIEANRMRIDVSDNIGYFGPYEETLRRHGDAPCWVGCYAGCRHLGIEADGGIKGCLSMQSSRKIEGNLHNESLATIWRRPNAFAYNRQSKLDDLKGFCRTCAHAPVCRGGCFSMRTIEGGENPFCYHRVAMLAAQQRKSKHSGYTYRVYAPTALVAVLGLGGCVAESDEPNVKAGVVGTNDAYGLADVRPELSTRDAYGIADVASQDGTPTPRVGADRRGASAR